MKIPHFEGGSDGIDPRLEAVQYFIDNGMTPYGAIGLVANLYRESNLSPDSINSSSGAYGIAQWLGTRKKNLFKMFGDKPTYQQQLQFVSHELDTTHKVGKKRLNSATNAEDAAKAGFGGFEFSVPWEAAVREMNKYGQNGLASLNAGIKNAKQIEALWNEHQRNLQGKLTPVEAKNPSVSKWKPSVKLQTPALTQPTITLPEPTPKQEVPEINRARRNGLFQSMMQLAGLDNMFGL